MGVRAEAGCRGGGVNTLLLLLVALIVAAADIYALDGLPLPSQHPHFALLLLFIVIYSPFVEQFNRNCCGLE